MPLLTGRQLDDEAFQPLFARWARRTPLTDGDRRAIIELPWTRKVLGREAYLVREGEPTTSCTLLLQGFAFRQKLVSDGARQIISFHIPGEFLDVQNGLLEVADHNVQSLTRSVVVSVSKDALTDLMSARPNVRRSIWLDMLLDASIFREWVVNVGRRDARRRIAHLLCELVMRLQSSGQIDGPPYDFPITQEQMADATGLTAVHTNRTLQGLRKDGLIELQASKLTVLDWEGLTHAGDFTERYLHHSV
jgi:CRP-like cAMP-binding protein